MEGACLYLSGTDTKDRLLRMPATADDRCRRLEAERVFRKASGTQGSSIQCLEDLDFSGSPVSLDTQALNSRNTRKTG